MRKKKLLNHFPPKKHKTKGAKGNLLNARLLQLNSSLEEIHCSYAQAVLSTLGNKATAQRYLILGDNEYIYRHINNTLVAYGVPESQINTNTYMTNINCTQISYSSGPGLHVDLPDVVVLVFPRIYSYFTMKLMLNAYRNHFTHAKHIFIYSTYKSFHNDFRFNAKYHTAYLLEFARESFADNLIYGQPSFLMYAQDTVRLQRKGN